jgi:hypothetical protein
MVSGFIGVRPDVSSQKLFYSSKHYIMRIMRNVLMRPVGIRCEEMKL